MSDVVSADATMTDAASSAVATAPSTNVPAGRRRSERLANRPISSKPSLSDEFLQCQTCKCLRSPYVLGLPRPGFDENVGLDAVRANFTCDQVPENINTSGLLEVQCFDPEINFYSLKFADEHLLKRPPAPRIKLPPIDLAHLYLAVVSCGSVVRWKEVKGPKKLAELHFHKSNRKIQRHLQELYSQCFRRESLSEKGVTLEDQLAGQFDVRNFERNGKKLCALFLSRLGLDIEDSSSLHQVNAHAGLKAVRHAGDLQSVYDRGRSIVFDNQMLLSRDEYDTAQQQERVLMLGPTGVGKSTFVSMLATVSELAPDAYNGCGSATAMAFAQAQARELPASSKVIELIPVCNSDEGHFDAPTLVRKIVEQQHAIITKRPENFLLLLPTNQGRGSVTRTVIELHQGQRFEAVVQFFSAEELVAHCKDLLKDLLELEKFDRGVAAELAGLFRQCSPHTTGLHGDSMERARFKSDRKQLKEWWDELKANFDEVPEFMHDKFVRDKLIPELLEVADCQLVVAGDGFQHQVDKAFIRMFVHRVQGVKDDIWDEACEALGPNSLIELKNFEDRFYFRSEDPKFDPKSISLNRLMGLHGHDYGDLIAPAIKTVTVWTRSSAPPPFLPLRDVCGCSDTDKVKEQILRQELKLATRVLVVQDGLTPNESVMKLLEAWLRNREDHQELAHRVAFVYNFQKNARWRDSEEVRRYLQEKEENISRLRQNLVSGLYDAARDEDEEWIDVLESFAKSVPVLMPAVTLFQHDIQSLVSNADGESQPLNYDLYALEPLLQLFSDWGKPVIEKQLRAFEQMGATAMFKLRATHHLLDRTFLLQQLRTSRGLNTFITLMVSGNQHLDEYIKVKFPCKQRVDNTDSSGSCQFDSISSAMKAAGLRDVHYRQVRADCVRWLKENHGVWKGRDGPVNIREIWGDDISEADDTRFEQYLEQMGKDSEWGDPFTLEAACNVYNIALTVISYGGKLPVFEHNIRPANDGSECTRLYLACVCDTHFMPVLEKDHASIEEDDFVAPPARVMDVEMLTALDDSGTAADDPDTASDADLAHPGQLKPFDTWIEVFQPLFAESFVKGFDAIHVLASLKTVRDPTATLQSELNSLYHPPLNPHRASKNAPQRFLVSVTEKTSKLGDELQTFDREVIKTIVKLLSPPPESLEQRLATYRAALYASGIRSQILAELGQHMVAEFKNIVIVRLESKLKFIIRLKNLRAADLYSRLSKMTQQQLCDLGGAPRGSVATDSASVDRDLLLEKDQVVDAFKLLQNEALKAIATFAETEFVRLEDDSFRPALVEMWGKFYDMEDDARHERGQERLAEMRSFLADVDSVLKSISLESSDGVHDLQTFGGQAFRAIVRNRILSSVFDLSFGNSEDFLDPCDFAEDDSSVQRYISVDVRSDATAVQKLRDVFESDLLNSENEKMLRNVLEDEAGLTINRRQTPSDARHAVFQMLIKACWGSSLTFNNSNKGLMARFCSIWPHALRAMCTEVQTPAMLDQLVNFSKGGPGSLPEQFILLLLLVEFQRRPVNLYFLNGTGTPQPGLGLIQIVPTSSSQPIGDARADPIVFLGAGKFVALSLSSTLSGRSISESTFELVRQSCIWNPQLLDSSSQYTGENQEKEMCECYITIGDIHQVMSNKVRRQCDMQGSQDECQVLSDVGVAMCLDGIGGLAESGEYARRLANRITLSARNVENWRTCRFEPKNKQLVVVPTSESTLPRDVIDKKENELRAATNRAAAILDEAMDNSDEEKSWMMRRPLGAKGASTAVVVALKSFSRSSDLPRKHRLDWAVVGDSIAALFRKGKCIEVTDQTIFKPADVDVPLQTPAQHDWKHGLVGVRRCDSWRVLDGDVCVLMSDGITDNLERGKVDLSSAEIKTKLNGIMAPHLAPNQSPARHAELLREKLFAHAHNIMQRGGKPDDVSIVAFALECVAQPQTSSLTIQKQPMEINFRGETVNVEREFQFRQRRLHSQGCSAGRGIFVENFGSIVSDSPSWVRTFNEHKYIYAAGYNSSCRIRVPDIPGLVKAFSSIEKAKTMTTDNDEFEPLFVVTIPALSKRFTGDTPNKVWTEVIEMVQRPGQGHLTISGPSKFGFGNSRAFEAVRTRLETMLEDFVRLKRANPTNSSAGQQAHRSDSPAPVLKPLAAAELHAPWFSDDFPLSITTVEECFEADDGQLQEAHRRLKQKVSEFFPEKCVPDLESWSSQFRALSNVLADMRVSTDVLDQSRLRNAASQWLRDKGSCFAKTGQTTSSFLVRGEAWPDYCSRVGAQGTMADHFTLAAVVATYNISVLLFKASSDLGAVSAWLLEKDSDTIAVHSIEDAGRARGISGDARHKTVLLAQLGHAKYAIIDDQDRRKRRAEAPVTENGPSDPKRLRPG